MVSYDCNPLCNNVFWLTADNLFFQKFPLRSPLHGNWWHIEREVLSHCQFEGAHQNHHIPLILKLVGKSPLRPSILFLYTYILPIFCDPSPYMIVTTNCSVRLRRGENGSNSASLLSLSPVNFFLGDCFSRDALRIFDSHSEDTELY